MFRFNLDCNPKFHFGASPNQELSPMAEPRASSRFNTDRAKVFQFSDIKNFPDRGATTAAAHGFKFGPLANCELPRHLLLPHTQMKLRMKRI